MLLNQRRSVDQNCKNNENDCARGVERECGLCTAGMRQDTVAVRGGRKRIDIGVTGGGPEHGSVSKLLGVQRDPEERFARPMWHDGTSRGEEDPQHGGGCG